MNEIVAEWTGEIPDLVLSILGNPETLEGTGLVLEYESSDFKGSYWTRCKTQSLAKMGFDPYGNFRIVRYGTPEKEPFMVMHEWVGELGSTAKYTVSNIDGTLCHPDDRLQCYHEKVACWVMTEKPTSIVRNFVSGMKYRIIRLLKQEYKKEDASELDSILSERGSRYGKFIDHADITQELMYRCDKFLRDKHRTDLNSKLSHSQREALHMIFHKIGRILNGDPNYADSWIDIAGYAQLEADILEGNPR